QISTSLNFHCCISSTISNYQTFPHSNLSQLHKHPKSFKRRLDKESNGKESKKKYFKIRKIICRKRWDHERMWIILIFLSSIWWFDYEEDFNSTLPKKHNYVSRYLLLDNIIKSEKKTDVYIIHAHEHFLNKVFFF